MCIHRYIQRAWRCFSLPLPDLLTFPRRTCCGRSVEHSFAMQGFFQKILAMSFQDAGHQTSNLNRHKKTHLDLDPLQPSWLWCFFFTPFLKLLSDPCHTVDPWPLRGNPATMVPGPFHRTGQESLEVWPGAAGDECRLPENDCQGVWWVGPIKALTNYMLLLSYYIII